ncbi:MAG: hypothetical protein M1826_006707 [Phylliscum demangeonii]|nr:MAG: hypothetical protein M1826_006707 [Phylliscum demangeonii]
MTLSERLAARTPTFPRYLFRPTPFRPSQASLPPPPSSELTVSTEPSPASFSSREGTPPASSPGLAPAPAPAAPSYLSGHRSYLRCARCSTDLCLTSQIISKGFTGRHGRAYLVCPHSGAAPASDGGSTSSASSTSTSTRAASAPAATTLPNTVIQRAVPRQLVTGAHTVSDISCAGCGVVLGWKYLAAEDEAQRYKVGKFILETRRVRVAQLWEGQVDAGADGDGDEYRPLVDASGADVGRDMHETTRRNATVLDEVVQFDSQDEEECDDLFAGVWSPALAARRRKGRRLGAGELMPRPAPS